LNEMVISVLNEEGDGGASTSMGNQY
jgi:hypothetical protein